jgi:hypothetical protein
MDTNQWFVHKMREQNSDIPNTFNPFLKFEYVPLLMNYMQIMLNNMLVD